MIEKKQKTINKKHKQNKKKQRTHTQTQIKIAVNHVWSLFKTQGSKIKQQTHFWVF